MLVITPRGQLIAGQRRLEAHRLLKRTTILCCIVDDLKNATVLLQAEIMENTCRRGFSPSEAVAAAEDLLPLTQEAAQQRIGRHFDRTSGNFSEVGNAMDRQGERRLYADAGAAGRGAEQSGVGRYFVKRTPKQVFRALWKNTAQTGRRIVHGPVE